MNPDFGQVEADPAEVNLSAFETFFSEKRPFFIEGSGLLNSPFETYLLFAAHRRGADRSGARRLRRLSAHQHDSRRGQADGAPAVEDVDRRSRRRDRRGTRDDLRPGSPARTVSRRADDQLRVGRVQQEFGRNASTAALMIDRRASRSAGRRSARVAADRNAFTINGDSLLRFKRRVVRVVGRRRG